MDYNKYLDMIMPYITGYGLDIIAALAIFIVGRWCCRIVSRIFVRVMEGGSVDKTVIDFSSNIIYWLCFFVVIIASLGRIGIQTASIVAILGAAGLAVGLALQGSLSNFAAGVMIIIFRPFKAGDFIEAGGCMGVVKEIQIFNTVLTSPDNKLIYAPNAQVMGGAITNFSANETRRVDLVFGIGYSDSISLAKKTLGEILDADERVLKDPAYTVAVSELADSSVNFVVRPWVKSADYWDVRFDLHEKIKLTFDEKGISIPFPQRDVHIHNTDTQA